MKLTPEQISFFLDKGYIVQPGLFPLELIRKLGAEIDGLHEKMAANATKPVHVSWEDGQPADRPKRIRQLMHSEKVSPILDAMSRSDAMLDIIEQLIGPGIYLFHSKLMMKAARDGTFTPWHQDWGYWQHHTKRPSQVNCMLAIDPNVKANGALRFVEGSHKAGPIDHKTFVSASFNIGLEGDIDSKESTMVELQPGDAVFFGPLVVHGSAANTSDFDRRANTFAFDVPDNNTGQQMPEEYHRRGSKSGT